MNSYDTTHGYTSDLGLGSSIARGFGQRRNLGSLTSFNAADSVKHSSSGLSNVLRERELALRMSNRRLQEREAALAAREQALLGALPAYQSYQSPNGHGHWATRRGALAERISAVPPAYASGIPLPRSAIDESWSAAWGDRRSRPDRRSARPGWSALPLSSELTFDSPTHHRRSSRPRASRRSQGEPSETEALLLAELRRIQSRRAKLTATAATERRSAHSARRRGPPPSDSDSSYSYTDSGDSASWCSECSRERDGSGSSCSSALSDRYNRAGHRRSRSHRSRNGTSRRPRTRSARDGRDRGERSFRGGPQAVAPRVSSTKPDPVSSAAVSSAAALQQALLAQLHQQVNVGRSTSGDPNHVLQIEHSLYDAALAVGLGPMMSAYGITSSGAPPLTLALEPASIAPLGVAVSPPQKIAPFAQQYLQPLLQPAVPAIISTSVPNTVAIATSPDAIVTPAPTTVPVHAVAPTGAVRVPVPAVASAPAPIAVPAPVPVAVPAPAPIAVPAPVPVAVPAPAPIAVPAPAPVAVPAPAPVAVPAVPASAAASAVPSPVQAVLADVSAATVLHIFHQLLDILEDGIVEAIDVGNEELPYRTSASASSPPTQRALYLTAVSNAVLGGAKASTVQNTIGLEGIAWCILDILSYAPFTTTGPGLLTDAVIALVQNAPAGKLPNRKELIQVSTDLEADCWHLILNHISFIIQQHVFSEDELISVVVGALLNTRPSCTIAPQLAVAMKALSSQGARWYSLRCCGSAHALPIGGGPAAKPVTTQSSPPPATKSQPSTVPKAAPPPASAANAAPAARSGVAFTISPGAVAGRKGASTSSPPNNNGASVQSSSTPGIFSNVGGLNLAPPGSSVMGRAASALKRAQPEASDDEFDF